MYYTKYRPHKFSEMLGSKEIPDALSNQVKNGKTSHAYLFVGPRGTGKTTAARILAKALNCKKPLKSGDPCDRCASCTEISTGNYLDLIEIDAASNRGIDDIRDLKDKISLAPTSGKMKVYIIDEVHMLTQEAFNALLKTLEEPPSHATFVLCTTEDHKVPDTIKSRCQVFKFKRATITQLVDKLEQITTSERVKTKFKKEDLERIAKASHGGFRDAETLLQQVVEGELDIETFVGSSVKEDFVDFVDSLEGKDANSAIRQVNMLYENGVDLFTWTMELLRYMRDLLFISADAYEGLIDVTESIFSRMEEQAARLDPDELVRMIEVFVTAQNDIKGSVITQLPLELAIIKVCTGEHENDGTPGGANGGYVGNGGKKSGPGAFNKTTNNDIDNGNSNDAREVTKTASVNTKLDTINSAWDDVLKGVVNHNHGVQALLKAAKPVEIADDVLILEVFYKFHKERLETSKNKRIVETVLEEIFGEKINLKCTLSAEKPPRNSKKESGDLTDLNVQKVSGPIGDKLVDVFDGALPL